MKFRILSRGYVCTTGEKLQKQLKDHGPLALFERRLPIFSDSLIQLVYEECSDRNIESWKFYALPIDTF